MPSNLNRYSDRSIARATRQAVDRTDARVATTAHNLDAVYAVGREVKFNFVQSRLESKAIEMMMPELSSELNCVDQSLLLDSMARLRRLDRDL